MNRSIAYTAMKKNKLVATILAWVLITAFVGTLALVFYNAPTFASIR